MLFSDETGFSLHPKLGRIWSKKGIQPFVTTRSQHNQRLNIFGWVDPVGGRHGMVSQTKGNTDGFLDTLKVILHRYTDKIIELFVDQARWHKGPRVDDFLCCHKKLRIHYIPKYHPELNFQETLWRTMRYEETTNIYYETMESLKTGIFSRSRKWKPKKILSLCHFI